MAPIVERNPIDAAMNTHSNPDHCFGNELLPTATELPMLTTLYKETPSPLNPLGVKGVGEVGTIPAAAAIISAVEHALEPFGVHIAQVPITPHKLVELIAAARHTHRH